MAKTCSAFSNIWNIIILLIFHLYVTYFVIIRYVDLKNQIISQRYGTDWSRFLLDSYLSCIIISNILFLMFLLFAINPRDARNMSNKMRSSLPVQTNSTNGAIEGVSSPRTVNLSFNPSLFQLMSTYILLLPLPWVIGEQVKNGAKEPDFLWQTDWNFILPPKPFRSHLTAYSGLHPTEVDTVATALFSLQPPALGGLGQLPQTEQQLMLASRFRWYPKLGRLHANLDGPLPLLLEHRRQDFSISPEFVNYILAVFYLASNLPTMFWYKSRAYACMWSALLALTGIHLGIDLSATGLLIKYITCLSPEHNSTSENTKNDIHQSSSPVYAQLKASLMLIHSPVRLPVWILLILTLLSFMLTVMNIQLVDWIDPFKDLNDRETGLTKSMNAESVEDSQWEAPLERSPRVHSRFTVSILIVGPLLTLITCGVRIPVQKELFRVVQINGNVVCSASIIVFAMEVIVWISFWIGLAFHERCCRGFSPSCYLNAIFNNTIIDSNDSGQYIDGDALNYMRPPTEVSLSDHFDHSSLYRSLKMKQPRQTMTQFFQSLVRKDWIRDKTNSTSCSTTGIPHFNSSSDRFRGADFPSQSLSLDNSSGARCAFELKSPIATVRPGLDVLNHLSNLTEESERELPRLTNPPPFQLIATQRHQQEHVNPTTLGSDCLIACSESASNTSHSVGPNGSTTKCELTFFNGLDRSSSDGSAIEQHRYQSLSKAFKQKAVQSESYGQQCIGTYNPFTSVSSESHNSLYRLNDNHTCIVSIESFPQHLHTSIDLESAPNDCQNMGAFEHHTLYCQKNDLAVHKDIACGALANHWLNTSNSTFLGGQETELVLNHDLSQSGLCSEV